MVKNITDNEFNAQVIQASNNKLVLVDFWAPWCGPCNFLAPILEELSKEMADKIEVIKVNVDENQQYASQFGVRSIPAVFFFKNGNNVDNIIGVQPKAEFITKINQLS